MGVLWTGVCALIRCALKGRSLKAAYPVITEKVDRILIRQYRYILDERKVRDAEDLIPNDGCSEDCLVLLATGYRSGSWFGEGMLGFAKETSAGL